MNQTKLSCLMVLLLCGHQANAAAPVPSAMLDARNAWRAQVSVPDLVWSDKLQISAQKWAETLKKVCRQ